MTLTAGVTTLESMLHPYPAQTIGGYSVGYSTAYGSQAKTRSFRGRLPAGYTATKRYPLVIALHGGRSGGEDQETMTQLSARADRDGFIAVYPDGLGWDIVQVLGGGSGSLTSITVGGDEILTGTVNWTTNAATTAGLLAAAVGANGYTGVAAGDFVYFAGPHGGNVQVVGTMSEFIAKLNPGWNASDQVTGFPAPSAASLAMAGCPSSYVNTDTWAERWHLPDVDFIRQLIGWVKRNASVDDQRIYIMGFSNGARMAHRCARELSDLVAGVGCMGAGIMLTNYDTNSPFRNVPARPVPLIYMHGTRDPLAYYGGEYPYPGGGGPADGDLISYNLGNAYYLNPDETVKEYVLQAGGDPTKYSQVVLPEVNNDIYDTSMVVRRWNAPSGTDCDVELWRLINTGHTWPMLGAENWAYVTGNWATDINFIGRPNYQFSATDTMLKFLLRHRWDSNAPVARASTATHTREATRQYVTNRAASRR